MMTLVIFLMGVNSNIDDEGGGGGQKGHFRDDVICERSLCDLSDAYQLYSQRAVNVSRPSVYQLDTSCELFVAN